MTSASLLRAAALTLGCRLNQAETALLFDRLRQVGYTIVRSDDPNPIDVLVVNTCTVTGTAAQKSRQAVRKLRREHPESCIVVTGCSAEIEKSQWAEEDAVDILVPNTEKGNLVEHLNHFLSSRSPGRMMVPTATDFQPVFREGRASGSFPFHSRALLKIQEGCNNFCSYCIVPYARGRERSRDAQEVIAEFQTMLQRGFQEIVIAGVNVSSYNDHGLRLADLLRRLTSFPGQYRLRLSSTEPHPANRGLAELMGVTPNICRFLHLSAQNGADAILQAMNRHYTVADYEDFAAYARAMIPDLHLGTDLIIGFPGETEAHFEQTCDFVRRLRFANTHIFTFSPREGTPAATMSDPIPPAVALDRYRRLRAIADDTAAEFRRGLIGKVLPVIFERRLESGDWTGWSDNYVKVVCADPTIVRNVIIPVTITGEEGDRLRAKNS